MLFRRAAGVEAGAVVPARRVGSLHRATRRPHQDAAQGRSH